MTWNTKKTTEGFLLGVAAQILVLTAVLAVVLSSSAHADQRFLNAALYFLRGVEGIEYKTWDDGIEALAGQEGRMVFRDQREPCTIYLVDLSNAKLQTALKGPHLMTALAINFSQMPSPRDFGFNRGWYVTPPPGTLFETTVKNEEGRGGPVQITFPPTGKVWSTYHVNAARQLNALDFIRNNYCPGLREVRGF
jgi:hypothetical protein